MMRGTLAAALSAVAIALALAAPLPLAPAQAAPPLGVDLDAFDASKRSVDLSNGMTLAYVDAGARHEPTRNDRTITANKPTTNSSTSAQGESWLMIARNIVCSSTIPRPRAQHG